MVYIYIYIKIEAVAILKLLKRTHARNKERIKSTRLALLEVEKARIKERDDIQLLSGDVNRANKAAQEMKELHQFLGNMQSLQTTLQKMNTGSETTSTVRVVFYLYLSIYLSIFLFIYLFL